MARSSGKFAYTYAGDYGIGVGFFIIEGTRIRGGDWGGLTYKGSVKRKRGSDQLEIELTMNVPAGGEMVMGTSAQDLPQNRSFSFQMPRDFQYGSPFEITVPPGRVWITARPLPARLSWLSSPRKLQGFVEGIAKVFKQKGRPL